MLALVASTVASRFSGAQTLNRNLLQLRLPAKADSVSRTSGLFLEVRDDGLGNGQYGYRRVMFDVQSPKPVTADTQITVRATVTHWHQSQDAITIEADGELLAGQQKTTLELRFPQTFEWQQMWWQVWIDAVPDEELSIQSDKFHTVTDLGISRWRTTELLVLNTGLENRVAPAGKWPASPQRALQVGAAEHEAPLATNWLDLTPYDYVYCDISHLLSTAQDHPERMAALRKWVHAGGILWLQRETDDWQQLHDLEPLFGWQSSEDPIEPAKPEGRKPPGRDGWSYVNLRRMGATEEGDGLVADYGAELQPMQPPPDTTPIYSEDMFVVRRHGWGMVAAFQNDLRRGQRRLQPTKVQLASMYWQMNNWPMRHGLIPGTANAQFSNWLIPGVGLAPVVSFQVLITLFVLGIGPVNYWLLKRAGKLHLMLLAVPVVAVVITVGLLGYGLLSDGVATRLRARSITLLDQQTGDATSWSRLSYYAGFAPRNGLSFSDQAAVYTIYPGSVEVYDPFVNDTPRDIEWVDGEQRLTSGWLASRTPTQYLVIQPRTTTAGLAIEARDSLASARNDFGSQAQLLLVQDEQGTWWLAEDVPASDTTQLKQVEHREAVTALREVLRDREPRLPDALATIDNTGLIYQQQNMRRNRIQGTMNYGYVASDRGLLQGRWQELLGLAGGEALDLPPRSYVVVSDKALLPLSEDDFPVEESSVHLVIGKW